MIIETTDRVILGAIYSYIRCTNDPESCRSVDLSDLDTLNVEDLLDYKIPEELFTVPTYSKEDIEFLLTNLSRIITTMEEKNIENL